MYHSSPQNDEFLIYPSHPSHWKRCVLELLGIVKDSQTLQSYRQLKRRVIDRHKTEKCRVETWTLKAPNCPWKLNPSKAVLKTCATMAAMTQQKNVCQLSVLVQNEDKSSMANRRPPIGALNPADTPAATPAVVNSRLNTSTSRRLEYLAVFKQQAIVIIVAASWWTVSLLIGDRINCPMRDNMTIFVLL